MVGIGNDQRIEANKDNDPYGYDLLSSRKGLDLTGYSSSHNNDGSNDLYHQCHDDEVEETILIDDIRERFEKYGFVVLRNCFSKDEREHQELLGQWQRFSEEFFINCFEILHQNGHIDKPYHEYGAEGKPASNENDESRNDGEHDGKDSKKAKSPPQKTTMTKATRVKKYTLGLSAKHGFEEIVMRSPGRYEISLLNYYKNLNTTIAGCGYNSNSSTADYQKRCDHHPSWKALIETTILSKLVPSLLHIDDANDDESTYKHLKLCHVSLVVATPGCNEQTWHSDGGHVSLSEHLPCHVLNVFLPLEDVPLVKGPTEFRPGTHVHTRNLGPMILAAKCRKSLLPPYTATMRLGDVLIFDYRVLHRGKANNLPTIMSADGGSNNRTFLVLTYAQSWFEDVVNFPKRSMLLGADGGSNSDTY